jgi:hypothetical protein
VTVTGDAAALLALIFFRAVAGLPPVLTLYNQQGSNTPRLNPALGVTAFDVRCCSGGDMSRICAKDDQA